MLRRRLAKGRSSRATSPSGDWRDAELGQECGALEPCPRSESRAVSRRLHQLSWHHHRESRFRAFTNRADGGLHSLGPCKQICRARGVPHRIQHLRPRQPEDVAFRNPDGSLVLLVLNSGGSIATFNIAWAGKYASYKLP